MRIMIFALALFFSVVSMAAEGFNYQGFKAAMQSEKQVKDVTMTDQGNLYIGMLDNGSSRKGYAMYLCEVARDYALPGSSPRLIRVIDIAKAANGDGFHTLGRTNCTF